MVPQKRNFTAIALTLLAMVLAISLGLWPLLVLATPFLLICVLCRMIGKKTAPATAERVPAPPAAPVPTTEQSMLTIAFGLLQRRITEAVQCHYPKARWAWTSANAREQFATGAPLSIILNGSGGYRRANVLVRELQFCGLVYQTAITPPCTAPDPDNAEGAAEEEPESEGATDYGLLAFEWMEANMQHLNDLANEAVAQDQNGFCITSEDLPHGDSWPAICKELTRNGFSAAEVLADGIQVRI